MSLIPRPVEQRFNNALDRIIPVVVRTNICPNSISTIGCLFNLVAALFLLSGQFVVAGVFVLFAGVFDMIDGKLARLTLQTSSYGAVYDATMDRIGEIALYTGIGWYFILHHMYLTTLIVVVATGGSLLISYIRARAESFSIPCNVGILRRGERIVLFGLGAILNFLYTIFHLPLRSAVAHLHIPYKFIPMPITVALIIIAALSPITVAQRLLHVKKQQTLPV